MSNAASVTEPAATAVPGFDLTALLSDVAKLKGDMDGVRASVMTVAGDAAQAAADAHLDALLARINVHSAALNAVLSWIEKSGGERVAPAIDAKPTV